MPCRCAAVARLACLLVLAGCASAATPSSRPQDTRGEVTGGRTYAVDVTPTSGGAESPLDASVDAAWDALPRAYATLGLEGAVLSADQHLFGTPRAVVAPNRIGGQALPRLFDCGTGPAGPHAATWRIRMAVRTQLVPRDGGGTSVRTEIQATARSPEGTGGPVRCADTGRLPGMILGRLIALTTAGGSPAP